MYTSTIPTSNRFGNWWCDGEGQNCIRSHQWTFPMLEFFAAQDEGIAWQIRMCCLHCCCWRVHKSIIWNVFLFRPDGRNSKPTQSLFPLVLFFRCDYASDQNVADERLVPLPDFYTCIPHLYSYWLSQSPVLLQLLKRLNYSIPWSFKHFKKMEKE